MIPRREICEELKIVYENYMNFARYYRKASTRALKEKRRGEYFVYCGLSKGYEEAARDIKEVRRIYELL